MAEKQQADDRGKRRKRPYAHSQHKRRADARELCPGIHGILITCNSQERQCLTEAYNLLNEYGNRLYGPEKAGPASINDEEGSEPEEDGDIQAALAKEVAALKQTAPGQRRFQSIRSGAKNVIFIRCSKEVDVCQLVHDMLEDMSATKKAKARFCQRFLPASDVSYASISSITEQAKRVLAPHFHKPACEAPTTFGVVYKCRNNTDMDRDTIIKAVADVAVEGGIAHKVDLANPVLVISVEIVKTMCCMSVVKDFYKFKRYNIHSILTDGRAAEEPSQTSGTAKDSAAATTEEPSSTLPSAAAEDKPS
eukprot:scpid5279/ scgid24964/ THUMP domain-containing protein 1